MPTIPIRPSLQLLFPSHGSPSSIVTMPRVDVRTDPEHVIFLVGVYWENLYDYCPVFPKGSAKNLLDRYFEVGGSSTLLDDRKEPLVRAIILAICALASLFHGEELTAYSFFRHAQDQIMKSTCTRYPFEYLVSNTLMVWFLSLIIFTKTFAEFSP